MEFGGKGTSQNTPSAMVLRSDTRSEMKKDGIAGRSRYMRNGAVAKMIGVDDVLC